MYFTKGAELFAKAISEATDEAYKERIVRASLQIDYALSFIKKLQYETGLSGYKAMIQAYIDANPAEFASIDNPSSLATNAGRYARKQAKQAYEDYNWALKDKLVSVGIIYKRDCEKDLRTETNLDIGRTPSYW